MGLFEPDGRGRRAVRRHGLSPTPAPVIVVHSLAQAEAALAAAAGAGREIVLASAPGAGIYAGPGWWRALVEAAREAVPSARFSALLDCGEQAGAVLAAIRVGAGAVVFTGRADVARRLAAIAQRSGLRLETARPAPALDLGADFFAGPACLRRRCAEILASSARLC